MRKLKLLGLIGAAAGAAAFCVHLALAATRTLDVNVQLPPPPNDQTGFWCSPPNLRSANPYGYVTMQWALANATSVAIDGIGTKYADGTQQWNPGICSGCDRTFYATFANDGGSKVMSCTVGLHCFLKGTQILMADGSHKNIEDVQVGDTVMSYDTETGKYIGSAVVKTTKNDMDKYYIVNDTLKVTPGHVLFVNGQWTVSNDMKVGDQLLNANGERVTITSLKEIDATVDVYDLITEEPHDFYAENYLVHNLNAGAAQKEKGLAAGMKVAMADGRELAIEQVKTGDKILSFDPKLKRYAISVVKQTGKQSVAKTLLINGKLRIAMGHQVYLVPPANRQSKVKNAK